MEELRVLIADEGYILTNGEIYSTMIYLGIYDSPDNYYQITLEEYQAIIDQQEEYNEEI